MALLKGELGAKRSEGLYPKGLYYVENLTNTKEVGRMSEPVFYSNLTMEEIEENFKDIDLFSGIMEALEEALSYRKQNQPVDTNRQTKEG